jgi:hypothetical protein
MDFILKIPWGALLNVLSVAVIIWGGTKNMASQVKEALTQPLEKAVEGLQLSVNDLRTELREQAEKRHRNDRIIFKRLETLDHRLAKVENTIDLPIGQPVSTIGGDDD